MRVANIQRIDDELGVLLLFRKVGMSANRGRNISIRLVFDKATEYIPQFTHSIISPIAIKID